MFALCDRRIMRENCYCPRPQKVCLFQLYTTGKLETWLWSSLEFNKSTQVETSSIVFAQKMISPFV